MGTQLRLITLEQLMLQLPIKFIEHRESKTKEITSSQVKTDYRMKNYNKFGNFV